MPIEPHLIIGLSFGKINDAKATFSETLNLSEPGANVVHAEGDAKMDPVAKCGCWNILQS
jgi:hypothetical protein